MSACAIDHVGQEAECGTLLVKVSDTRPRYLLPGFVLPDCGCRVETGWSVGAGTTVPVAEVLERGKA